MKMKVNKAMLPMKGHYFLYQGGVGVIQPFMTVYAKQLGFNSSVVGTVFAILPVAGMLAKPTFGAIADRFKLHKFIFLSFLVLTILSFFCIQFVPAVPLSDASNSNLVCDGETIFKKCSTTLRDQCMADDILFESAFNVDISCSFKCDWSEQLRNETCSTWGVTDLCSLNAPLSVVAADGSISPVKLEFTADVPLNKSLQVQNCLHFFIRRAHFADGTTHVPWCSKPTKTDCEVSCNDSTVNSFFANKQPEDVNVLSLYQFWIFFWLLVASWVGMAVVVCTSDAICFELLGEKASQYGLNRMWGSIGWGLFAIIVGFVIDAYSRGETVKNYTPMFYMMLILLALDFVCSYFLKYDQTKLSGHIFKDVGRLFLDVNVVVFLISCIFFGMGTGLVWSFLYWFLEELATNSGCGVLDQIKTIQGLVSGVQCFIGELPSFFLSGWILKKIGHSHAMSLVFLITGLRFILYSVISNPWWCLPIEVCQFAFGLFYPTMTSYAAIVAAPGTEATVQGLVSAIFEGIGVSLGSLLGGFSTTAFGTSMTYRIFGLVFICVFILNVLVNLFFPRRLSRFEAKDFNGSARYAPPSEAISMLETT